MSHKEALQGLSKVVRVTPRLATSSSSLAATRKRHEKRPRLVRLKPFRPRPPPPTPASWTPFQVSDLLLDLDAFDSKHVRPFGERDAENQTAKWRISNSASRRALLREAEGFAPAFKRAHVNFSKAVAGGDESGHWRVNDFDLMSAAFQGVPPPSTASPTPVSAESSQIADSNTNPATAGADNDITLLADHLAIPLAHCQEDSQLLEWLVHRQSRMPTAPILDAETSRERLGPQGKGKAWTTFQEWRRLVTSLIQQQQRQQDEHGLGQLGECLSQIAQTIVLFSPSSSSSNSDPSTKDLLSLLTTLRLHLRQNGLSTGPSHLCEIGIILSAAASRPQAARHFFQDGLEANIWDEEGLRTALSHRRSGGGFDDAFFDELRGSSSGGGGGAVVRDAEGRVRMKESVEKLRLLLGTQSPL